MSCPSCGREVAAGARYCIHCGAEQSVPTPIAAVAAALMARASQREAANAAHAESASASGAHAGSSVRVDDPVSPAPSARHSVVAANVEPARPVYASNPGRRGLAIALFACCAIVAAALAAAVIWRIEGEPHATSIFDTAGEPASGSASSTPAPSAAAPPAGEMPASGTPAPAQPDAAASAENPAVAARGETPSGASMPVEIKALPPRPAASRATHAASAAKAPPAKAPSAPAAQAASEPTPATPPEVPAKPKVAAVAPAASHVADRWRRLDDELSKCTREDFITRVICSQRVRFRYCDGYWGKVPACPGSPAPERGQ